MREVRIPSGAALLEGELGLPADVQGLVLFAHGSGSSRHSRRNRYVARILRDAGIGTLLFDLPTLEKLQPDLLEILAHALDPDLHPLPDGLPPPVRVVDTEVADRPR
jgi:hypothetical protein